MSLALPPTFFMAATNLFSLCSLVSIIVDDYLSRKVRVNQIAAKKIIAIMKRSKSSSFILEDVGCFWRWLVGFKCVNIVCYP